MDYADLNEVRNLLVAIIDGEILFEKLRGLF